MNLKNSKEGEGGWQFVVGIVLLLGGTFLVIYLIALSASKADESSKEALCRSSNAIRFGAQEKLGVVTQAINAPRACATIEKKDALPTKGYRGQGGTLKEGALREIRDLSRKCWWMWLEGRERNMFSKFPLSNDGCFICYTFFLDNGAAPLGAKEEVYRSMAQPYETIDSSDKCGPGGGGWCRSGTSKPCLQGEQPVSSSRCQKGSTCCTIPGNECKSKGGTCSSDFQKDGAYFSQWKCPAGNCYVPLDRSASYLDYIQGMKGVGVGVGYFTTEDPLVSKQLYAVTFVSPTETYGLKTTAGAATSVLGGAVIAAAIGTGIGIIPIAILLTTESAALYQTAGSTFFDDHNRIFISRYDAISSKCSIQASR